MVENNKFKNLFISVASSIKDINIKDAVFNTIPFIPEYFYSIPSSSSGKYHPEDEISEGGLVLHTIKDVKVAEIMAPMYDLSEYELDLCKAALLLHDACKSGKTENSGHTEFLHPVFAAELILESNADKSSYKEAKKIAKLIKTHMGRWNTSKYDTGRLQKPFTKLQKFVHLCDYVASRKDFNINVLGE